MKLVSKFKDYYDHISHKYGADPDCVYVRAPLGKPGAVRLQVEWSHERNYFGSTLRLTESVRRRSEPVIENARSTMRFVVVGARVVPFIVDLADYFRPVFTRLTETNEHRLQRAWRTDEPMHPTLPSGEHLCSLIRAVGAPVFVVEGTFSKYVGRRSCGGVWVSAQIPVLADLGFPSFVSAQEIWQDIYATLTNVLRSNPDKAPPVQVEEKYRIEAAGFDLKSSFRHPVNEKNPKKSK